MSRFLLSDRAKADIDGIWDYIAIENGNPTAARQVLNQLNDAFAFLADHPGSGTLQANLRPNLRMFSPRRPAHNYIVFFCPIEDGIEVSAVIHGARDYPVMFDAGEV